MATPLTHRAARSLLLRLPAHLRSSLHQSRSFSCTSSRRLTLVDVAVAPSTAVFDTVHALGIPWYATLPLVAILVRGTFVYYFSSLPARIAAQKRVLLHPLIDAKAGLLLQNSYTKDFYAIQRAGGPKSLRAIESMSLLFRARNTASQQIGKPFGAPRWTGRSLINFGTLIAFTEAIRLKCGSGEGLLPLLLSPAQAVAQKVAPESFPKAPEPEVMDPASFLAERLEAARQQQDAVSMDTAAQSGSPIHLSSLGGPDTSSAYFDSTLTTEGLAWFTNLTLPDQSLMFPAALFGTFITTILLRPTIGKPRMPTKLIEAPGVDPAPRENVNRLVSLQAYFTDMKLPQRLGLFVAIVFGAASMKMPVAILLYLIPSIAVGWLQSRWLDFKYPLPPAIQKCTRPMRMKVKRRYWA